jgi:hypothetical protein
VPLLRTNLLIIESHRDGFEPSLFFIFIRRHKFHLSKGAPARILRVARV